MPALLDQLSASPSMAAEECPGLLSCLAAVTDPRDPRGRLHPLTGVLAICAAAVLTGATSLLAIRFFSVAAPE
ncbi:transposase family protein [Streptomyces sp. NPDC000888]